MTIPFRRVWAMPNAETFSIPPITELLKKWLNGKSVIIDPFARNSRVGTHRNDLDPTTLAESHMEASAYCQILLVNEITADAILFDPPYSPRQISEVYRSIGRSVGMEATQNARLYKEVRDGLDALLISGGIAISFGWNSAGFGEGRGYEIQEILLVPHGGAHNDTIVIVERKMQRQIGFGDLRDMNGGEAKP